jgi:hypothetical protein
MDLTEEQRSVLCRHLLESVNEAEETARQTLKEGLATFEEEINDMLKEIKSH